jgi:hypothetical protein
VSFAAGKFSYGLCDYCGQRYKYNTLRKNWRGFMVCPDDYEPKEPQLEPLRYRADSIALRDPRPDRIEPVSVFVGAPGFSAFQSFGTARNTNDMRPYIEGQALIALGSVGKVTVTTT